MPFAKRTVNLILETVNLKQKGSKFIVSLLIVTLLFLVSSFSFLVSAQQSALERAQQDYNFQFTKYRDSQEEYTSTKAAYESFKTATAKNSAYVATRDYITQVDRLYLAYIALTKEHGNAIDFSRHGQDKDKTAQILDSLASYLNDHMQKISQTKTLEQLPPLARELKKYLASEFQLGFNKTLAIYEVVETEATLNEFLSLSRILDRVVVFKLQAGETRSILANWSSEIKDIQTKTQENINLAREALSKTNENTATDGQLEEISQIAQKAKNELKRSKPLFEEVVRII